ncbi:MAG: hypothetical protein FGM61_10540 [Sediminibacterium sp.]|nr:hypothetical protein [Sediminibacterium sp.]
MKNTARQQRISLALLLSTVVFCMAFLADNPVTKIQHKLIFNLFLDPVSQAASLQTTFGLKADSIDIQRHWKFNPFFYPDSTLFFQDDQVNATNNPKSKQQYLVRSIQSSYYASPGYVNQYTREMLGEDYPDNRFVQKYKQQFGIAPFSKTIRTAKNEPWHFWSGAAVEKIFRKYYGKPDNRFQQVSYGMIYQIAAKRYMKDYVYLLNHVLVDQKPLWDKICAGYYSRAIQDSSFDGSLESYYAFEKLFTKNDLQAFKVIETSYLYHPIGELIRRQIDGSLPAIIRCIRVILQDYDPALLRELKV